jgi:hypothetical protein
MARWIDNVPLYNTLLVEGSVLSGLGFRVAGAAAIENATNVSAAMSRLVRDSDCQGQFRDSFLKNCCRFLSHKRPARAFYECTTPETITVATFDCSRCAIRGPFEAIIAITAMATTQRRAAIKCERDMQWIFCRYQIVRVEEWRHLHIALPT